MEHNKPFSARLSWLIDEFERLSVLFNQMLVRIPPLAMAKEYKIAFSDLYNLYNAILYLSLLIDSVYASTPSVDKNFYLLSKVKRYSRCIAKIMEQYESLECRSLDIFTPEQQGRVFGFY